MARSSQSNKSNSDDEFKPSSKRLKIKHASQGEASTSRRRSARNQVKAFRGHTADQIIKGTKRLASVRNKHDLGPSIKSGNVVWHPKYLSAYTGEPLDTSSNHVRHSADATIDSAFENFAAKAPILASANSSNLRDLRADITVVIENMSQGLIDRDNKLSENQKKLIAAENLRHQEACGEIKALRKEREAHTEVMANMQRQIDSLQYLLGVVQPLNDKVEELRNDNWKLKMSQRSGSSVLGKRGGESQDDEDNILPIKRR